jgi:ABC-type dipeptide/oligopeptide/nickel transport system permease component
MTRILVRRLIALIPLLIGMTLILFVLTNLLPSDPARFALGEDATPEQIQAYREMRGLDDPLWTQYLRYVGALARGDFGTSLVTRRPVIDDLRRYLPATLELTFASLVISTAIALPLGIVAAVNRGRWIDRFAQVLSLFTVSMPVFWFGVILQIVFFAQLGWFPSSGRLAYDLTPPETITGLYTIDSLLRWDLDAFVSSVRHLILPAIALSNINLAILARITRSAMLDVLSEPYVVTARAKGLKERRVVLGHAFRNAVLPVATIGALRFGDLMAGAILTEVIFSWPGIGRYAVVSIERVDFPALMGFAVAVVVIFVIANLLVDMFYAVMDPRIRI